MGQLIDTSVFIALERRGLSLEALALVLPNEPMWLAAITASELLVGVYRADTPARRQRRTAFVEAVLAGVPVVPFDLRVARVHAHLVAELTREGQGFGAHDMQIAATAIASGSAILTDNVRHFGRVDSLQIGQPDWTRIEHESK